MMHKSILEMRRRLDLPIDDPDSIRMKWNGGTYPDNEMRERIERYIRLMVPQKYAKEETPSDTRSNDNG